MSKVIAPPFTTLDALAEYLRQRLEQKKYILLFAYNGTGKTRLSMAFKELGKQDEERDTLYFNAFTEDLFSWDNDLDGDQLRVLRMNTTSRFFNGLQELEMENRIRPLLQRYADFDFYIDYDQATVSFTREVLIDKKTETIEHIKVSRGEESIFVWCFFLAVAQLAVDEQEAYSWVKYLFIDDPISSLDDNNAIAVASHLAQLLKNSKGNIRTVITSHHHLFFNVMCNELSHAESITDKRRHCQNCGIAYSPSGSGLHGTVVNTIGLASPICLFVEHQYRVLPDPS